jgi:RNA exonuclease NGL2
MLVRTRTWKSVAPASFGHGSTDFTLMQWNQLADGLAQDGGFVVDPDILKWEFRGPRVLEEIRVVNPDILCMQEVNRLETLSVDLKDFAMLFAPKLQSAALRSECPPDGTCMFVSRKIFDLLDTQIIYYKQDGHGLSNQNGIIAVLEHLASGHRIIVATTHLKAKSNPGDEAARLHQIRQMLTALNHVHERWGSALPIILCGDFNSPPTASVYAEVLASPLHFASAYNAAERHADAGSYSAGEPPFTTWKFRDDAGEKKSTIDYIFWSVPEVLRLQSVLELADEATIGPAALPSASFASDHLSLAAKFGWSAT